MAQPANAPARITAKTTSPMSSGFSIIQVPPQSVQRCWIGDSETTIPRWHFPSRHNNGRRLLRESSPSFVQIILPQHQSRQLSARAIRPRQQILVLKQLDVLARVLDTLLTIGSAAPARSGQRVAPSISTAGRNRQERHRDLGSTCPFGQGAQGSGPSP